MEESGLTPGWYEGHDCFPVEEASDVVAIVGGERIYSIEYTGIPDVLCDEAL